MSTRTPEPSIESTSGGGLNELGKIAESYDELHNIPHLRAARGRCGVSPATYNSAVRTVFQAAEVALLNLTRLTRRMSCHVAQVEPTRAFVLMRWICRFHSILRRIGATATALQLAHPCDARPPSAGAPDGGAPTLSIQESNALKVYIEAQKQMEAILVAQLIPRGGDALRAILGRGTHDDLVYALLHELRMSAHDGSKWESDLCAIPVDAGMPSYHDAVAADVLEEAVRTASLPGDTFYGEFVCLHQIPELLCDEANDHVEAGIRHVRANELTRAAERVATARALLSAVIESQRAMVECLSTSEYHQFRENLGPASGMHSLAIRQHMFRDLFNGLWNELEAWISKGGDLRPEDAARELSRRRHDSSDAWLGHALVTEALKLHQLHEEWRHEHLHMPRNCLGSGGTKSMIGVPDGLETVLKMRDAANAQPALRRLHQARSVKLGRVDDQAQLTAHHSSDSSIDNLLKRLTGEITRDAFPEVQQKELCRFHSPHPVRKP